MVLDAPHRSRGPGTSLVALVLTALGMAACAALEPIGSGPPLDALAFQRIHAQAQLASAVYENAGSIDAAATAQNLRVVE